MLRVGHSAEQSKLQPILVGFGAGLLYGLLIRIGVQRRPASNWLSIMSVSFLFLVPFGVGLLSVYLAERRVQQQFWRWLLLPWAAVTCASLGTMLLLLEGWICVVMFLPIGLFCGSMGGILGGLIARHQRTKQVGQITTACVLLLPFLVSPWEARVLHSREIRRVENTVEINAPPSAVWDQIKSVPAIRKPELSSSWSRRIGFPDPIEATLSRDGIGGIRHATFSGGVEFVETVDVWEPSNCLAFSIHPLTAHIPSTTLDEHVTVGGPFFDVLRGKYTLEAIPSGGTRLHLQSEQRVSTDFNWYAHLWSDAVMADLQRTILDVVKHRAESAAKSSTQ